MQNGPFVRPRKQAGHPRVIELRRIVEAVFYLLRTRCQWRALPHEFPPWPTVFYHFAKWRAQGTWGGSTAPYASDTVWPVDARPSQGGGCHEGACRTSTASPRARPKRAARAAMTGARRCPAASGMSL